MSNYLTLAFAYFLELIIVYIYFRENYNLRRNPFITMLAGTGLYGASFFLHILLQVNFLFNILSFLAATFLFALICFEISVKSSLFHSAVVTFLMAATEMVVEAISMIVLNQTAFLPMEDRLFYLLYVIITKLLMFITLYAVAKAFSYKRNNALGDMKTLYISMLYPITISGFLIVDLYFLYNYELPKGVMLAILILTVVSIFIACFIVMFNQRMQRRENELAEFEHQQLKNEIDMQYLDLLEMKNREMQILTHDYKNHLAAIREMSSSKEVAEYIDKMNDEIKTANSVCHSGNHMLDILINKYVAECYSKNVDFTFDVKLCNLSYVESFDLVTILGNALDNALDAAENSEAKKILFSTKRVNTYDTVIIENSCDIPPDSKLKTTKKKKGSHGIGMKSIAKTLKKYDGDFLWEYNETDKTFTITIMLLNKED